VKRLLGTDHFSVDGPLIEAWASMKSFRPKSLSSGEDPRTGSGEPPTAGGGRNREADFHGQTRSNATHASTTDPQARLYRKGPGKEAKLCFMGHALMENRNGLVVEACLTGANGHAGRIAALHRIEPRADRPRPLTLGADKACDAEDFVNALRSMNATPHVAQNVNGRSSIDGRTTRHAGYAVRQRIRKRIEEAFGWIKTIAGRERTQLRGRERVGGAFTFAAAASNLAAVAEAAGGLLGKAPANCRLIGRWRIVEADLWDRARLDLCGPARLTITAQGGEIAFGALEAGLEGEYARDPIGFYWAGCEEGDEVDGEGTAELLDDGTLEIEFEYRNGDEPVLKAKRDHPSSTAC
jgi:Transposase DDE domain